MPSVNEKQIIILTRYSRDVAAGVRRLRGAEGLGLEARARRGGAGRHHDRRAQAGLRQGEGREGEEGGREGKLMLQG